MASQSKHVAIEVLRKEIKAIDKSLAKVNDLLWGDHVVQLCNLKMEIATKTHASLKAQSEYLGSVAPKIEALEKKRKQSRSASKLFAREDALLERRDALERAVSHLAFWAGY